MHASMLPVLSSQPFTLRPPRRDETSLLRMLFAQSESARDLSLLPDPLREDLLDRSLAAWTASLTQYQGIEDHVVEQRGEVMGRLILSMTQEAIVVVDLVVAEHHRGRGVATAVLQSVMKRAKAEDKPMRLTARRDTRALGLYRRLGFAMRSHDEIFTHLEWVG